jgi:hypothetical protein
MRPAAILTPLTPPVAILLSLMSPPAILTLFTFCLGVRSFVLPMPKKKRGMYAIYQRIYLEWISSVAIWVQASLA